MKKSLFKHYYDGDGDISMEGQFTRSLYELWFKADNSNKVKLHSGFPDFFSPEDLMEFTGSPYPDLKPKQEIKPKLYILTNYHDESLKAESWVSEEIQLLQDDENEIVSVDIKPTGSKFLSIITYSY